MVLIILVTLNQEIKNQFDMKDRYVALKYNTQLNTKRSITYLIKKLPVTDICRLLATAVY